MMRHPVLAATLLALPFVVLALPSHAQDYPRPPGGMSDDGGGVSNGQGGYGNNADGGGQDGGGVQPEGQDPAGLSVRVNRLEGRLREMTGQIEELQNDNRKLIDQLQKFQADVDSRFSTSGGARSKRSEAVPAPIVGDAAPVADAGDPASGEVPTRKGHDDSFDPDTAPLGSPGKPKPLGSVASASTPADDSGAPMDLAGGKLRPAQGNSDTLAPTLQLPSSTQKGGASGGGNTVVASIDPASPRAAFDEALGFYKDKQYDNAEKGFASFIDKNPKSRLIADATYYLGATFAQRGRSREAAEQYLKVCTDFATSARAPEAMLHLGMSLKALGGKDGKEQACATFSEVVQKYPNAPPYVKSGVERETKRAQCSS